ncbi:MAG: AtpZ/AtpI family protein [candidate division WOR-3 bacterium]
MKIFEELKKEARLVKIITRLSAVGLELVVSIVIGLSIGVYIDKKLNTSPWGLMAFLF